MNSKNNVTILSVLIVAALATAFVVASAADGPGSGGGYITIGSDGDGYLAAQIDGPGSGGGYRS